MATLTKALNPPPEPEAGSPKPEPLSARFARAFGDAPADDGKERDNQRTFRYLVFGMFAVYIGIAVAIYLTTRTFITPDIWALFLLVGAVVLGRLGPFLRDWIPFVLLIFGYEFLRGIAGEIALDGQLSTRDTVRSDFPNANLEPLMRFDLGLFGGVEPIGKLQDWFYEAGTIHWYDWAQMVVYGLHFVIPCLFAFGLWLTKKDRFWLFTLAFCFMTYVAFVFFLFYPAIAPWTAKYWGMLDIASPSDQVLRSISGGIGRDLDAMKIWDQASPHPMAAMPSLHAGFPWLMMMFAIRYFGWWGLLALIYNAALWFSIMYSGNHWVVDALAGVAWAAISFVIVDWLWFALTVDDFANVPRPLRAFAHLANRAVIRPFTSALAPLWNAPGNARRAIRKRLSAGS